jgi:hypothetical protein
MRLPILMLSLAACSGGEMHGDDEPVNCATETRDDVFVVGLAKMGTGGALEFKLMSANPAPPARDDNTWQLQLSSVTGGTVGAPVPGATLTVTPFMPDHQHGSGKAVVVEPMTEAGHYNLTPINLWMPGLWETTISASSASGSDSAVFRFCIPS